MTVVVTDDGVPPRTAAQSFKVFVRGALPPTLGGIKAEMVGTNQVITIAAHGEPGSSYRLQRSTDPLGPTMLWSNLVSQTAAPGGQLLFTDTNAPSPSFYRIKYPATP